MSVKKVIAATVGVFVLGLAVGAGVGVITAWKNADSDLPVATYSDLNKSQENQVNQFVENQEDEHPEGLNDITVDGKYVQPPVDGNGNLIIANEEPNSDSEPKQDTVASQPNTPVGSQNATAINRAGVITVSESGSLRMRKGPGTDHEVIGGLHRDDKVTVLSEKDGWYEIETADKIHAWVSAEYVSLQ